MASAAVVAPVQDLLSPDLALELALELAPELALELAQHSTAVIETHIDLAPIVLLVASSTEHRAIEAPDEALDQCDRVAHIAPSSREEHLPTLPDDSDSLYTEDEDDSASTDDRFRFSSFSDPGHYAEFSENADARRNRDYGLVPQYEPQVPAREGGSGSTSSRRRRAGSTRRSVSSLNDDTDTAYSHQELAAVAETYISLVHPSPSLQSHSQDADSGLYLTRNASDLCPFTEDSLHERAEDNESTTPERGGVPRSAHSCSSYPGQSVQDADGDLLQREREYGVPADLPPPVRSQSPLRAAHSLWRSYSTGSGIAERIKREQKERTRRRSVRLAVAIGHKLVYAMSDPGHGFPNELPQAAQKGKQRASALKDHASTRSSWSHAYPPLESVLHSDVPFPSTSQVDYSRMCYESYDDRLEDRPPHSTRAPSSSSHATEDKRSRKASNKLRKALRTGPAAPVPPLPRTQHELPPSLSRRASRETLAKVERRKSLFRRALTMTFMRKRRKSTSLEQPVRVDGMEGYDVEPLHLCIRPSTFAGSQSWTIHEDPSADCSVGTSGSNAADLKTSRQSRHGGENVGDRPHAGALMTIQSQTKPRLRMPKGGLNAEREGTADAGQLSPRGFAEPSPIAFNRSLRSGVQPHFAPSHEHRGSSFVHGCHPSETTARTWGHAPLSSSQVAHSEGTGNRHRQRSTSASGDMLATVTAATGEAETELVTRTSTEGGSSLSVLPDPHDHHRDMQLNARGDKLPVVRSGAGEVDRRGCGASDASLRLTGEADAQGCVSETAQRPLQLGLSSQLPPPPLREGQGRAQAYHLPHYQQQQQPERQRPRVLTKRSRSESTSKSSSSSGSSRPSWGSRMGSTSESHTSHTSSTSMSSTGWPSSPTPGSQSACPELSSGCPSSSSSPGSSSSSSASPPTRPHSYFSDLNVPSSIEPSPLSAPPARPDQKNRFPPLSYHLEACQEHDHAPRKLTKRRPASIGHHHHSASAPVDMQSYSAWAPSSPPGIAVSSHGHERGRSPDRERGKDMDGKAARSRSRSRSRGVLGIRAGVKAGGVADGRRKSMQASADGECAYGGGGVSENGHVDFLPPLRPPSPLWAGSFGKLPSPYSRQSCVQDAQSPHAHTQNSTTDALTSLAFTGNTGLLSSPALAALTSRLTHRTSGGQLYSLANEQCTPPPFIFSVKEYDHAAFDPYAEERERRNSRHSSSKFARRARVLTQRPSIALLRLETNVNAMAGLTRKPSPIPPVPPLPAKYAQQNQQDRTRKQDHIRKRVVSKVKGKENSPDALRRWTLAMADVTDEVLVQELEKLRMEGRGARKKRRSGGAASSNGHSTVDHGTDEKALVYGGPEESKWREEWVKLRDDSDTDSMLSMSEDGEFEDEDEPSPVNEDETEWKSARRALLCCRELVRTERSYQSRLRQLLAGETETAPPALVLTYVPALLSASEALLSRLEDDPSAWGVSAAFVGVEEEVEAAFVAWCGVVGEIFLDDGDASPPVKPSIDHSGRKTARSAKTSPTFSPPASAAFGKRSISGVSVSQARPENIYRKRTATTVEPEGRHSTGSANGIGMFTAALGTGLAYSISPSPSLMPRQSSELEFGKKNRSHTDSRSRSMAGVHTTGSSSGSFSRALKRMSVFASATSLPTTPTTPSYTPATFSSAAGRKAKKQEKKPTVRELAIQPTQRVMRYVLQYRDLLANTPVESPSRGLVERALESALRIAAKCDRAQGNSAFLRRP